MSSPTRQNFLLKDRPWRSSQAVRPSGPLRKALIVNEPQPISHVNPEETPTRIPGNFSSAFWKHRVFPLISQTGCPARPLLEDAVWPV